MGERKGGLFRITGMRREKFREIVLAQSVTHEQVM